MLYQPINLPVCVCVCGVCMWSVCVCVCVCVCRDAPYFPDRTHSLAKHQLFCQTIPKILYRNDGRYLIKL